MPTNGGCSERSTFFDGVLDGLFGVGVGVGDPAKAELAITNRTAGRRVLVLIMGAFSGGPPVLRKRRKLATALHWQRES